MLLPFLHWLKKVLIQTLMFNLSEVNWIASPSSNCNQWLLDDSMKLQLIHTVHHLYHWLWESQFPEHKLFLCCFNGRWIDGKDIFCVAVQYSELKFLRRTLHCLKLLTQSDTVILRSLICLKRSFFFFPADEMHWLRLMMESRSAINCKSSRGWKKCGMLLMEIRYWEIVKSLKS